jgi:hypothetical protein
VHDADDLQLLTGVALLVDPGHRTKRLGKGGIVGLFNRRHGGDTHGGLLPGDLVARLEPFGRFEFDPQGSGVDAIGLPSADYTLMETAKADPDGFIAALSSATLPLGGWTAYGAMKLIWHLGLTDPDVPHEDADSIRLAALQFVRGSGYGWEHLTLQERAFWQRAVGVW